MITTIILIVIVAFFGLVGAAVERNKGETGRAWIKFITGIILISLLLFMQFGTAAGKRELKTAKSNISGGLNRTVRVYSMTGELIEEISGKFDYSYDADTGRVLFDKEDGKIYSIIAPTGTIVIEEVG